ncbi:MAG: DUF3883 domain-containing protein [Pseudomonadota bacterium]
MLRAELAGEAVVKAEHNRALQLAIDRGRGAIEFKHQNVSAVLLALGETWITGYKPAWNYQRSLEDAVARWLSANPEINEGSRSEENALKEPKRLMIGSAPTLSNYPETVDIERQRNTAIRFDAAGRDQRNRRLGRAGEEAVLDHERWVLREHGRRDLADAVHWVSEAEGDGAGYDIESFEPTGESRLIEVKTTNGWNRTPFLISRNELRVSEAKPDTWCLMRVWNFAREPQVFELRPPLSRHVSLLATNFEASFL